MSFVPLPLSISDGTTMTPATTTTITTSDAWKARDRPALAELSDRDEPALADAVHAADRLAEQLRERRGLVGERDDLTRLRARARTPINVGEPRSAKRRA